MMKHVCVAAKTGDGEAPGAANIENIRQTSNDASRGWRSRFQAHHTWMRPRSATLGAPIPRDSCAPARSHPRKRGPCSTLRCAADFGRNPGHQNTQQIEFFSIFGRKGTEMRVWGWPRVLAHGIVASHWLRMTKRRVLLRALSQNRASASRVSLC